MHFIFKKRHKKSGRFPEIRNSGRQSALIPGLHMQPHPFLPSSPPPVKVSGQVVFIFAGTGGAEDFSCCRGT